MKAKALVLGAAVAMAAGPFIGVAAAQAAPAPHTVYVTQAGHNYGRSFNRAHRHSVVFHSINKAVAAVAPGGKVVVEKGTFHEDVAVAKTLRLEGTRGATIDATKLINGIKVTAPRVTVSGFTLENAVGEGILVQNTSHVTIEGNTVRHNDLGVALKNPVKNTYAFCQPQNGMANDCGENIHLVGASYNLVQGNVVTDGSGGVLLTDETGPTSHNQIIGNYVSGNSTACGVVMGGHNPNAAPKGVPAPTVAGVFDNLVSGNTITGSGLKADGGAGVQMSTGLVGGAVYQNTVTYNSINGNGHSGITVHSHAPGQYLNGDVVTGNQIGTNNLNGDFDFKPADPDTTGVYVGSVTPLSITVSGNKIGPDHYGIFTDGPVSVIGEHDNRFVHDTVNVSNN